MEMENRLRLSRWEHALFARLNSARKVQDWLNALPFNHGNTCNSPGVAIRDGHAHCFEGALLAAAALWAHGQKPLILDLRSTAKDFDHTLALFKQHGHWGAISKTNHAVLRYREPIYKSIRELALSYFEEYFDKKGKKNLRAYSKPINLARFDKHNWMTSEKDIWYIPEYLCEVPHTKILKPAMLRSLRKADS